MSTFFGAEKSRELGTNWSAGPGDSAWVDSKTKMAAASCRKKKNDNNDKKAKIPCHKERILTTLVFVPEQRGNVVEIEWCARRTRYLEMQDSSSALDTRSIILSPRPRSWISDWFASCYLRLFIMLSTTLFVARRISKKS